MKVSTKGEDLYRFLLELVRIPSVSPGAEENRIANFIKGVLQETPYFKEHPQDLMLVPMERDPFGRHILFAVVRAKPETSNTLILMGHMDVVDTSACGTLKDLAFDPEQYTKEIRKINLPPDARKDLESGEWLFGRGISDMKGGIATGVAMLCEAAWGNFSPGVNLAGLFVCDEENNSGGMLRAVSLLADLQEEGLKFSGCIDLEPTFAGGGEGGPSIYLGSIGKINPFFYFVGKETHVGEYYEGLTAASMVSQLNVILDGNPKFADQLEGISYPPYGCMRQVDLRREYSATIMTKAIAFYSYLTASKMPREIMEEILHLSLEAQRRATEQYEKYAKEYIERNGSGGTIKKWEPKAFTYGKLFSMAREKLGEQKLKKLIEEALGGCPKGSDEREKAFAMIEAIAEELDIQPPFSVVGILPPWYPHRTNLCRNKGEKLMRQTAQVVATEAQSKFGVNLKIRKMFEGVSDLSYCGFEGCAEDMEAVRDNLPGWGELYDFPGEALLKLDIPILSFGPHGKDAHKNTERIHVPYFLEVYPQLLKKAIDTIAELSTV
ncbi:peptidase M20 [Thermovirga lienii DSM 17291]|jgi:arginine utilization protein RocB|uniref:Peptidase M20 n=1 Tax=Thermovirga lienii (strain ATCC BAA-1197 / DSM 17291 / Cas60314) TaxID=580340 RepID=G7V853_THELD|nr:M20/M25/M40 family metallo-hydrolase [Thermovirga lienii]AER67384.1 peptidase M20 [Thermovirga lienii DSM 17291]MDN5318541.1 hypothetical protein [Thermovirga sp.]MDN5368038.1 hypothetical protein [Thermovirga sp.]